MDGADCIGLCRLFYKDKNWKQDFKDGREVTKDWQEKEPYRLVRYLESNFSTTKNISDLSFGDIALINYDGDYHLGIYLEDDQLLGMQIPCLEGYSMSTIYRSAYWVPFFIRGFRRNIK